MTDQAAPPVVVRRADGVLGGEVTLRTRVDEFSGTVYELIVDGVFTMDTAHTATERQLATTALARVDGNDLNVVIGGLGLGYTVRAVLTEPSVNVVEVIELEPDLVDWVRTGVVPGGDKLFRDPRIQVSVGDVATLLPARPSASVDCILLDVDNGPGFLVHDVNASVYKRPFLRRCLDRLRPGGVLAVWSADPSPKLHRQLRAVAASCEELTLPVYRDGYDYTYALYLAKPA